MSRHRNVRNFSADDLQDYDEYDDYEEEGELDETQQGYVINRHEGETAVENAMTEEQKAQMRSGYEEIRQWLPENLGVTRAEIEDALWHYYFEVQPALKYLSETVTRRERKNQSNDKKATVTTGETKVAAGPLGSRVMDQSTRHRGGHIQGCARRAVQSHSGKNDSRVSDSERRKGRQANAKGCRSRTQREPLGSSLTSPAGGVNLADRASPAVKPAAARQRCRVQACCARGGSSGRTVAGGGVRNVFDDPELLAPPSPFATAISQTSQGPDGGSVSQAPGRPPLSPSFRDLGKRRGNWTEVPVVLERQDEIFDFSSPSPDDAALAAHKTPDNGGKRVEKVKAAAARG